MKSLGIELKGNTCIGVIVDAEKSVTASLKLELSDSYNSESILAFRDEFLDFINSQKPESVVIKKRNEKGKFAGGAVSFKMEGIIQLCAQDKVSFLSGSQLKSFSVKAGGDLPEVKKYQSQALFCALYGLDI